MPTAPTARNKAIQYLANREHSYLELSRKLQNKEYSPDEIEQALNRLVDDNLLSDIRFGEAYVRSKVNQGQGPVRIHQQLLAKGLLNDQIEHSFTVNDIDWDSIIERVWLKKFTESKDVSITEKSKQWRFLQYRGFTPTQITSFFNRITK